MKKYILPMAVMTAILIASCGPSAEEIAAKEKARQDSIAAVEKARQDSISAAEREKAIQDSIAAAVEKARQDSIAMAEEAKKKGGKPKPKPKKEEPKKDGVIDITKKGSSTGDKIDITKKGGK